MEQDRYKQSHAVYIIGIINLLLSLIFFAFTAYIMPFLLFKWVYKIPPFIIDLHDMLQSSYEFSDSGASWSIFLFFLSLAVLTAVIADIASNKIDNQIYGVKSKRTPEEEAEHKKNIEESLSFSTKLIFLIILVLIGLSILQWFTSVP